jgi:hypothetical protein
MLLADTNFPSEQNSEIENVNNYFNNDLVEKFSWPCILYHGKHFFSIGNSMVSSAIWI